MRAILFAIGQAFSSFYRRAFITFLSIVTITIALVILGAFGLISLNLRSALGNVKRQVQLEFYLKKGTTEESAKALIKQIESESGVESAKFITAEDVRKEFIEEFGDELLKGLPENPFPSLIRVKPSGGYNMGEAVEKLSEKYKASELVEELSAPNRIAYKLAKASRIFLLLTAGWGLILLISATLIITNTIRLAISSRQESVKIMRLVGASRSFVRLPFLFEGVLHGAISGGLAWLVLEGLTIATGFVISGIEPLPKIIYILIIILGAFYGGLGSSIAIRKHLKY